ncbi:MAG: DNA-processing protein DprA, partial [Planctomycetota bacterium]
MLILLMSGVSGGSTPNRLRQMISAAGSPGELLGASVEDLGDKPGIDPAEVDRVLRRCDQPALRLAATQELRALRQHGVELVTTHNPLYPQLLRTVPEPPLALWIQGSYLPEDVYSLAVMGSSRCTDYGRTQAQRFGASLAEHGVTVINGGERGIDTAALEAALGRGGRAIVALGSGLLNHQRPASQKLYESIVQSGQGALISSVPMHTAPDTVNQVHGDHLVIGSSIASLIVEAGLHSGAMIASRIAVDELVRQVFALPGPVEAPHSAGPLKLIRSGRAAITIHPDGLLDQAAETAQELAYRIARAYPALKLREGRATNRSPLRCSSIFSCVSVTGRLN